MSLTSNDPRSRLPATIDPIDLGERGARLSGVLPLKAMPRLAQVCLNEAGEARVDLTFDRSEGHEVHTMRGAIDATVRATCQRCLEPMELRFHAQAELMFVRPLAGAASVAEDAEVIEVDKPLVLSELIEDELLLAMPMIPMHEFEACPAKDYGAVKRGKRNPFAALKDREPTER